MKKRSARSGDEDNGCLVDRDTRTIFVYGAITRRLASKFRKTFLSLEQSDPGASITVEINSSGGEVDAGHVIIDTIMLSLCRVRTIATGEVSSMGVMILAAGDDREALPKTIFMVHPSSWRFSATEDELTREVDIMNKTNLVYWNHIDQVTYQQFGFWKDLCAGKDLYLTVDDALRYNLIHKISERNS